MTENVVSVPGFPWFSEDGSQDREMWQRMQDSLNRIVGTSSSIK